MTKSNHANKLAEEIIERLRPDTGIDWRHKRVANVEGQLQPMFDLLRRVHQLVDEDGLDNLNKQNILEEIEQLTREYDNET